MLSGSRLLTRPCLGRNDHRHAYGALRRLLEDRWIERFEQEDSSREKQAYRLTAAGQAIALRVGSHEAINTGSSRTSENEGGLR